MRTNFIGIAAALGLAAALAGGCHTAPETSGERATLASDSDAALASFKNADPSLNDLLKRSVGYAIFPDVGKAGFIAGGAYGHGEVYEGGKKIGYANVSKGSVG